MLLGRAMTWWFGHLHGKMDLFVFYKGVLIVCGVFKALW